MSGTSIFKENTSSEFIGRLLK